MRSARRPQAVRIRRRFTGADMAAQFRADELARNVVVAVALIELFGGAAIIIVAARIAGCA